MDESDADAPPPHSSPTPVLPPEPDGLLSYGRSSPPRPRVWPCYVAFPVMFGAGFLGQALVVVFLVLAYLKPAHPEANLEELGQEMGKLSESPWALAMLMMPLMAAEVGASVIPAAISREGLMRRLGLTGPRISWVWLAAAAIGAFCYSLGAGSVIEILKASSPALETLSRSIDHASGIDGWMMLALVGIVGPLAEELFFRGYLQTRLAERHGAVAGILIASSFFAVTHMDVVQSTFAFGFGIYIGIIAYRARSILPAIVAHMLNNTAFTLLSKVEGEISRGAQIAMAGGGLVMAVLLLLPCLLVKRREVQADCA